MHWIYLSPHFDDAVYSCGGLIWEQAAQGHSVEIWTVCAGPPPAGALSAFAAEHHARWETGAEAVAQRRLEDQRACKRVGAKFRRLAVPDCIYRRVGEDYLSRPTKQAAPDSGDFLYTSQAELFGPIHPLEAGLVKRLSQKLRRSIPAEAQVVCPLAIGGHVDHRLTRAAAEAARQALLYYLDFPYVFREPGEIERLQQDGWRSKRYPISRAGFEAWCAGIAAHQSQISTFWLDLTAVRKELNEYLESNGGILLWEPPADYERLPQRAR